MQKETLVSLSKVLAFNVRLKDTVNLVLLRIMSCLVFMYESAPSPLCQIREPGKRIQLRRAR